MTDHNRDIPRTVPFRLPGTPLPSPLAPPSASCCGNCRWFASPQTEPNAKLPHGAQLAGMCHFWPPKAEALGVAPTVVGAPPEIRSIALWPPVGPLDWCAQHQPVAPPKV